MNREPLRAGASIIVVIAAAAALGAPLPPTSVADPMAHEPIAPIPLDVPLDPAMVALGRRLFHEPRLSGDDSISCASCHPLDAAGADGRAHSVGVGGRTGTTNAPTVFNSGFNFKQFWDGRAATLEEQVGGPLEDPAEMASSWPQALAKLGADRAYGAEFAGLFPDGITARNVATAVAVFERSLYTANSRFDRYLRGQPSAITANEAEGYRLFKSYGCASCHQGMNVGGNMFQTFGVVADYFADRGGVTQADLGRFNVTGHDEDRYVFKVPSLRLAALTPPYFHDGSARTLADAVRVMAHYQLGRRMPDDDVDHIVAFLATLAGEYEGRPLERAAAAVETGGVPRDGAALAPLGPPDTGSGR